MVRASTDLRLVIPPLPPLHIVRPRLLSRLDVARDTPLVLLSAGPGTGKTVLLSSWARHHDGGVAWMTVTPEENEPARFWRLFLASLRAQGADVDDLPPSVLGTGGTPLLESLYLRIPTSVTPLILVIDEAHTLTHPHILDGLDCIVRGWYPQLRLVLAARHDPLLPLHRYRLSGLMRELRASDLAMAKAEAEELLAKHGVNLPPDALQILATRTEGWVAGIRLSALRMAGTRQPADFITELALDQGSIGEYLVNEVLSQQPSTIRQLLIQTAFLDEVSGPLADAVTGLAGSGQKLIDLARSNSFVVPLDPAETRFRYHRLFAEILQLILRQQMPHLVIPLQHRAAVWYAERGDTRRALKWAAAAGDWRHVASLLARGGLLQAFVDRWDMPDPAALQVLLDRIAGTPSDSDELRTARLVLAAVRAKPGEAAPSAEEMNDDDPELAFTADLARLVLADKAGDGRTVRTLADRLANAGDQRLLRAVPGMAAALLLARARAYFWDGRLNEAEPLLDQAHSAALADGTTAVELAVLGMVALVNSYRSRPARAEDAMRQAAELRRSHTDLSPPITVDLAAGLRAFSDGDLTAVTRAIRRAAGASGHEWEPAAGGLLTIIRALTLVACGQLGAAKLVLNQVPVIDGGRPLMLAAYRDLILASIETALGRPHSALRLLDSRHDSEFVLPAQLVRARAYVALGDTRRAQDCIRLVVAGERPPEGRYLLVEALLCAAEIDQTEGNAARAVEHLVQAAEIAGADIARPFLRTTDLFAPLLQRHPMLAGQWPNAAAGRPDQPPALPGPSRTSPFLETLTDRERAVLSLLTTSMSTAEIAEEMCVSVNTIKTHLAAIYRKLGAHRRREAVMRAREYEIL